MDPRWTQDPNLTAHIFGAIYFDCPVFVISDGIVVICAINIYFYNFSVQLQLFTVLHTFFVIHNTVVDMMPHCYMPLGGSSLRLG